MGISVISIENPYLNIGLLVGSNQEWRGLWSVYLDTIGLRVHIGFTGDQKTADTSLFGM